MIRRSGRTTALLCAAIQMAERGERVNFVVWRECEVPYVRDMLHELCKSTCHMPNVSVVPYHYVRRDMQRIVCVFDHHVTEELEYKRTGRRQPQSIQIALECNGWEKVEVIPVEHWDRGHYRMAMCEPLNTIAYSSETFAGDASATVKVVEFRRTSRVNKDGLMIFSHKG